MKIIFMGTPDFALASMETIISEGHNLDLVVTQIDKPQGRSRREVPSPVKVKALELGIPIYQPADIRSIESIEYLKAFRPDAIVVTAYGQILNEEILNLPRYGCINIHGSLLPKYRGASPIQHAIIEGDKETGITSMFMNKGLDTGDMIFKDSIEISDEDTYETLSKKLAELSRLTLRKTLFCLESNECPRVKQNNADSSYAAQLNRKSGKIDWSWDAGKIENLFKGTYPWPGVYTTYLDQIVKIGLLKKQEITSKKTPGYIIGIGSEGIQVVTGLGSICIKQIQLPGKKMMPVSDFLRGKKIDINIPFI